MVKKVLIVEDDLVTLALVQTLLESENFDVHTTNVGTNVRDILNREQPDILITDIMMPNTDGIENISAVKSEHPNVTIVAISSEPIYLEFAKKLGAHYCYLKPIVGPEFINLVNTISSEFDV